MPAKYFEFVDGQRLPGIRVKEFLMNQAVVQCENANEIQGSNLEAYGVRVAINKANGSIWVYMDIGGWTPLSNIFQQELDYEDLATELTAVYNARGTFLTQIDKDELSGETLVAYNAALTAQGLAVTADNKATGAVNTANLTAQGLTVTNGNVDSLGNRVTTAESTLTATNLTLTTTTNTANSASSRVNAITDISAGEIVVRKGPVVKAINGTTNETTIDGGNITTNSINVNRLQAGTLTGFRVQTSSSGQRVVMSESTNSLVFFNSGNTEIGRITGLSSFNYDTPTTHAFQINGSTVFSVNAGGIALSPGADFNSNLPVNGSITATSGVQGSFVRAGTSGSTLNSGGQVTVATFNTTTLAGNVRGANGDQLRIPSSDARIKSEIEQIPDGLNVVNQLNPVTFNSLIDDTDRRIPGFIAQDLEQVFDENTYVVDKIPVEQVDIPIDLGDDPLRTIEVTHIIPYLTKAIQELSAKNDALEARIAALEAGE